MKDDTATVADISSPLDTDNKKVEQKLSSSSVNETNFIIAFFHVY